eukprot:2126369-Prymnesium_polylepis.1
MYHSPSPRVGSLPCAKLTTHIPRLAHRSRVTYLRIARGGQAVPSRGPYRTARIPAERGEFGRDFGRTQTTQSAPEREKKNPKHRLFFWTIDTRHDALERATCKP